MPEKKRNYHMSIERAGVNRWECADCHELGTLEELRKSDCARIRPPCKHCGGCEESNECKPDCAGILMLLEDLVGCAPWRVR